MARQFDVDAARSTFQLPPLTRQQIQALMLDLDATAVDVIVMAVAQFWQRELGEPARDVFAELDELKQQVAALEHIAAEGYDRWFERKRDEIGL